MNALQMIWETLRNEHEEKWLRAHTLSVLRLADAQIKSRYVEDFKDLRDQFAKDRGTEAVKCQYFLDAILQLPTTDEKIALMSKVVTLCQTNKVWTITKMIEMGHKLSGSAQFDRLLLRD